MSEPNPADLATNKSPPRTPARDTLSANGTAPHRPTPSNPAAPPVRIGRFEVRGLLGEGAFARVYLGFDPELEREVAIKVPKADEITPEFRESFVRENRLAAIIHHPNICPVYEVGTDGNVPYIVMRVVHSTLAGLLKRLSGPMPPRNAVAITRKLAQGLTAAHAQKVVHRDLKPANVLYDEVNREVLIADFGLARFVDQASAASNGVPKGTPAYMAPEQARGLAAEVGPLSDVYALGVILYEMLTGRVPFKGSVWEVMRDHCEAAPHLPSLLVPGLDPRLDSLCLKAMAKAPADRYASAKEFASVLADYLRASEQSGAFPPIVSGTPPKKPVVTEELPLKNEVHELPPEAEERPVPRAKVIRPVATPVERKPAPPRPSESTRRRKPEPLSLSEMDWEPRPRKKRRKLVIAFRILLSFGLLIVLVSISLAIREELRRRPSSRDYASPPTSSAPTGPTEAELREAEKARRAQAESDNQRGEDYYFARNGVTQDYVKAREWYEKAAAQQSADAQYSLGFLYDRGQGVTQDYAKAREWYEKAAAQQNASAQYSLGLLYDLGQGVTQDYAKAREWYDRAAAQGHATAQNNLGVFYERGDGVTKNEQEAVRLYRKAADLGNKKGMTNLARCYEYGIGVTKSATEAAAWRTKAANAK